MKIPRTSVGKLVRITWLDPCSFDSDELQTGKQGLARWEEFGIITGVEEGIVTFVHAKVFGGRGSGGDTAPRYQGTVVPEDLIETVEELVVRPKEAAA